MWFFYFLVERVKRWWLVFSIGAIPFMVFFIVIAPVVISPMFNKFEPLKDKQLESQILTLAGKAGIQGSRVFEVDASKQSSKVNAYCTGLFGTTRIVLYDTLIKGFTYDEISFVMGHEMGHYVMHHIWYGLLAGVLFIFVMLWLTDKSIHSIITRYRTRFKFDRLSDIASLPLVLLFLTVFSFVFQPVSNGLSRYDEHQSDIYGMKITGVSGETAATAFDKLSAYNLSDPDPNPIIEFWFYSHPALKKRMEFVRNYRP
jgi:STE24 endopeptidase